MMKVVNLRRFKEEKEPHNRHPDLATQFIGPARCLDCGHKWEAVAHRRYEAVWLECPSCHLNKGRFSGPFELSKEHWVCNCGNDLFHISRNGSYCPNCGEWCVFPS